MDIREAVAIVWTQYRADAIILLVLLAIAILDGIYEIVKDQIYFSEDITDLVPDNIKHSQHSRNN